MNLRGAAADDQAEVEHEARLPCAVGAQMRLEGGEWQMTGQGELPVSTADSETPAADPSAAPPSSGEANDVLKKLMEQREKELK